MAAALRRAGAFEGLEGSVRRRSVLHRLERLLCRWGDSLWSPPSPPPSPPARVALVCFGSYRLGVHRPTSDIDALALCPPHCAREEFFRSLVALLAEGGAARIRPIPTAYTPVLKFFLEGIAVDLVFARLDRTRAHRLRREANCFYFPPPAKAEGGGGGRTGALPRRSSWRTPTS